LSFCVPKAQAYKEEDTFVLFQRVNILIFKMGSSEATTPSTPVKTTSATIKAAKKALKKHDSDTMKLKVLTKLVLEKLKDGDKKSIQKIIEESDVFEVNGKVVSLVSKGKKRKVSDDEEENDSNDNSGEDKKAAKRAKKEAKKKKKEETTSSSSSSDDSGDDAAKWRKENKVILKDTKEDGSSEDLNSNEDYKPYYTFDDSRIKTVFSKALLDQCTKVNKFTKPSPIQAQCWPVLLHPDNNGRKRDIVGIAETGSGKTLAFSMPALTAMSATRTKNKLPRMLVLAPTRELAMQSHVVLEEFGATVNLKSVVLYGGVPKHSQRSVLAKGVDCIVATPGRIKDLVNDGSCDLSNVKHLVLDEADRMLDMGFEEDVRFIISCTADKKERQTAMFSATWPAAIQAIAGEYMVDPVRVYVGYEAIVATDEDGNQTAGDVDDSLSANKRVAQTVEVIEDRARESRLRELLKKYQTGKNKNDRILLFALYKKEAERLEYNLKREGWNCSSIHGNKSQVERTKALADFKSGKCPLLVATDVAARGLDIPNVEVVLNYTFPLTIEDYVHRIGRTGRAGKNGISYTFFQSGDKSHAGELQQVMKQAGQKIPDDLMKFGSTIKKKEHKLYGNFGPSSGPMKKATKITFNHSDDED